MASLDVLVANALDRASSFREAHHGRHPQRRGMLLEYQYAIFGVLDTPPERGIIRA